MCQGVKVIWGHTWPQACKTFFLKNRVQEWPLMTMTNFFPNNIIILVNLLKRMFLVSFWQHFIITVPKIFKFHFFLSLLSGATKWKNSKFLKTHPKRFIRRLFWCNYSMYLKSLSGSKPIPTSAENFVRKSLWFNM